MKKTTIVLLVLILIVGGSVSAEQTVRKNVVRVNLGGLLLGPLFQYYGVDFAYERVLNPRIGVNASIWWLNRNQISGVGVAASADIFIFGRAPAGAFVNMRTGWVWGNVYEDRATAYQAGLSLGYQLVFPEGFVFRIGTGASYVIGVRFVPRTMVSVGYAF